MISIIPKDSQCLCNLLNNDIVKQLDINVTLLIARWSLWSL
jgi:hypothetical protein